MTLTGPRLMQLADRLRHYGGAVTHLFTIGPDRPATGTATTARQQQAPGERVISGTREALAADPVFAQFLA